MFVSSVILADDALSERKPRILYYGNQSILNHIHFK